MRSVSPSATCSSGKWPLHLLKAFGAGLRVGGTGGVAVPCTLVENPHADVAGVRGVCATLLGVWHLALLGVQGVPDVNGVLGDMNDITEGVDGVTAQRILPDTAHGGVSGE
jgi:hypothetical protein